MCFKTKVMTAQSIITKVNSSLYVIIGTIPFPRLKANGIVVLSTAQVNILYCQRCFLVVTALLAHRLEHTLIYPLADNLRFDIIAQ